MDAFEKHLSELKFQEPSGDLREKCLADLRRMSDAPESQGNEMALGFWSTWLWPHPKVWGGLAAVWFVCFGLNQWTLSLPNYTRSTIASSPINPDIQKITVLHYSLALDADNLDDILEPQTPPAEVPEDEIRPNAFLQRYRYLECVWLDTVLDTIRQRDCVQLPAGIVSQNEVFVWTLG